MPRTTSFAALTLAAALSLPASALADDGPALFADATPARLLADASPLVDAPVPRDAPELTDTPLASRDGEMLAAAGDPEKLLAQAPEATAKPPAPPAESLPRTGPELLLTLLAGSGLVLTGAGLRLGAGGGRTGAERLLPTADGPR